MLLSVVVLPYFGKSIHLNTPLLNMYVAYKARLQQKKKKNMVMFQRCPQGLRLVGESFDLHHALDRCM